LPGLAAGFGLYADDGAAADAALRGRLRIEGACRKRRPSPLIAIFSPLRSAAWTCFASAASTTAASNSSLSG